MGILRRLAGGLGAKTGAEVVESAECAIKAAGTEAARRPAEAARNSLRSMDRFCRDESLGGSLLGNESCSDKPLDRDLMRLTSENTALEEDNRLFCGIIRRRGAQTSNENRFSKGVPVTEAEGRKFKASAALELAERRDGNRDSEGAVGRLFAAL